MKELVEKMQCQPPTATGLVDRLLEKELVTRFNSSKDRRVVKVCLTEKGEKTVNNIRKKALTFLEEDLINFTKKEKQMMIKLLEKYCDLLENK